MRFLTMSSLLLTSCADQEMPRNEPLMNDSLEVKKIAEVREKFIEAYQGGNVAAAMSLYSPDYVDSSEGANARDRTEMRDFLTRTFETYSNRQLKIAAEEVLVNGTWALERGTFDLILTPREGGEEVLIRRRYLEILEKEADGSWKILRDLDNDLPVLGTR